jgi:hypothetical protein
MIMWLSCILSGFGGGVIGSFVIEAYQQRRVQELVYDHDEGTHR